MFDVFPEHSTGQQYDTKLQGILQQGKERNLIKFRENEKNIFCAWHFTSVFCSKRLFIPLKT